MKLKRLLLASLALATLSSCYVTPRAGAHSPYSPGGRVITPMERRDRSPLSPGGVIVTPRERRHRW